jgi:hypothetical protein
LPSVPNATLWQGSAIEVHAEVVPRYLWTTASINVYVDHECVISTGGVLRLSGTRQFALRCGDQNHLLELSWGSPARGIAFPFRLSVDGEKLLDSSVWPRNWPMCFAPYFGALVIVLGVVKVLLIAGLLKP